jgi:hypothetical protein
LLFRPPASHFCPAVLIACLSAIISISPVTKPKIKIVKPVDFV